MSVNTVPRFVEQPKSWAIRLPAVTTAATVTGGGNTRTLLTAAANGSKIEYLRFQSLSDTIASRFFVFLMTANNTFHLYEDLAVSAASSPGGTVEAVTLEITPTKPIHLQADWQLRVGASTNTADFACFASGGDY